MTFGAGPAGKSALAEWRAGWRVVAACAVGLGTGYPSYAFFASLFFAPLAGSFGWSRSELAAGQSLLLLLGALAAPVTGAAIDRFGVRIVALVMVPLYGCVLLGLAAMPNNLALYGVLMALLATCGAGTTALVFLRGVVRVFDKSRGLALAVARLGISISGLVLPPVLFATISWLGWRAGFCLLALLAFGLCLPAAMAQERHADHARNRVSYPASDDPPLAPLRVIIFCLAVALAMGPAVALLGQLQPVLVSKEIAPELAAMTISLFAAAVAIGAIIVGMLADRFWAPLIAFAFTAAAAGGMILLLMLDHVDPIWGVPLAALLVGLSQGAELDLAGYLIARYFGVGRFSRIFGLSYLMLAISSAAGAYAFGKVFDLYGSYDPALIGAAVTLLIASLLFLSLGRYPARGTAAAEAPKQGARV